MVSVVSWELSVMELGKNELLEHGLCWVHAERLINKLIPLTEAQRLAVETVQDQIWQLYQNLKAYKNLTLEQQKQQKAALEAIFDQIFTSSTVFDPLNQVLGRLWRRKSELLKVLDRPDLPIHNNASEQDIREFVTKRKISGSTRSDEGRRCRDTFASLKKTVTQARSFFLGIPHRPSVWQKGDSAFGRTDCPESGKSGHARRYNFSVKCLRNRGEPTQTY